jgi:hypothetical protein
VRSNSATCSLGSTIQRASSMMSNSLMETIKACRTEGRFGGCEPISQSDKYSSSMASGKRTILSANEVTFRPNKLHTSLKRCQEDRSGGFRWRIFLPFYHYTTVPHPFCHLSIALVNCCLSDDIQFERLSGSDCHTNGGMAAIRSCGGKKVMRSQQAVQYGL